MKHSFVNFIIGFVFLFCSLSSFTTANENPNIIFIMADDLGYGDLGCYGQKLIQTPNIDCLAKQGMRFTQAYAGGPVCAASRGSLMTGFHNGHSPVRDNIPHYHTYLNDQHVTIAEVLKQADYLCAGVGKWSLGDQKTEGRPTNQGFDSWFGYLNQDHAHFYYPEYLDDDETRLELTGNTKSKKHYSHQLLTERALEYIEQSHKQPFFLYAAYTVPHFSDVSEDPTRFAIPSDAPYSDKDWTQAEKNYAARITLLDQDVGKIVKLVDRLEISENTLIIFTSDNGGLSGSVTNKFRSNGILSGSKRELYEGGIRVPFIASWPGTIAPNTENQEIIAFWDVMPTLAHLTDTKAPENIDGFSFANALLGKRITKKHKFFYWDYGHCRKRYDQALRLGDYKGIRLGNNPMELYDLSKDPSEKNNIASDLPNLVNIISRIMKAETVPSDRYEIGKLYQGKPIWTPATHNLKPIKNKHK